MTQNQFVFLQLIKVGLWGERHLPSLIEAVQKGGFVWEDVIDLAQQQASVGVVVDALTKLPQELKPSKVIYFNIVALVSDIEKENQKMNDFAPVLMGKLKGKGIDSLLLKGQGVALCYPKPLHRQSGDIDLLIPDEAQFMKAGKLMKLISDSWDWDENSQHAEFEAMGFVIELHGKYGFTICPKTTRNLLAWNEKRLSFVKDSEEVKDDAHAKRSVNGLILPSIQFDAVFIFAHMLNHFMTGGVGLRQISDWMMLMNTYAEKIDLAMLEEDLRFLGMTKFWKAFASLAVVLLGFPKGKMPLYDAQYDKKVAVLMDAIFKTGNFGTLQKEEQLSGEVNKWVKKVHTAFGQIPVYWRAGKLFPSESLYCFYRYSRNTLLG